MAAKELTTDVPTFLHPNQRFLAKMIVEEHIRPILQHRNKDLEDFKDIDFQARFRLAGGFNKREANRVKVGCLNNLGSKA